MAEEMDTAPVDAGPAPEPDTFGDSFGENLDQNTLGSNASPSRDQSSTSSFSMDGVDYRRQSLDDIPEEATISARDAFSHAQTAVKNIGSWPQNSKRKRNASTHGRMATNRKNRILLHCLVRNWIR